MIIVVIITITIEIKVLGSFPTHIVSIHIFSYCPDSYVPTHIVSIQTLGLKFQIYEGKLAGRTVKAIV